MLKKAFGFLKDMLSSYSIGMMVVNCEYFRPMANRAGNVELRHMSDDQYLEFCGQIRNS